MRSTRVPLTFVVPMIAVLLSAGVIVIPTTIGYLHFLSAAHGAAVLHVNPHGYSFDLPRSQFLATSFQLTTSLNSLAVSCLNLPGAIIHFLVSASLKLPRTWAPTGMSLGTWRVLSIPIFALPFWWFLGLGLEGLLRWRRLSRATLLLGTVLSVLFLLLLLGLRFGVTAAERQSEVYPVWAFALWTVLFTIFPAAWVISSRSKQA